MGAKLALLTTPALKSHRGLTDHDLQRSLFGTDTPGSETSHQTLAAGLSTAMKLPSKIIWLLNAVIVFVLARADEKASVPLDESGKEGDLEILIVGSNGQRMLERPSISMRRLVNREWTQAQQGKPLMRLKYGTYKLSVEHPGFYPVERILNVQSPFQAFIVALFPARGGIWDEITIRGRLSESSLKDDCRWIRLVSPFGEGPVAETKASDSGYFLLENVPPGRYLAVTIGKEGICETSQVVVTERRLQDITLPERGKEGRPR